MTDLKRLASDGMVMFASQAVRLAAGYLLMGLLYLWATSADIALYANFIAVSGIVVPFLVLKPEALVGRAFFQMPRTDFERYGGSVVCVILVASVGGGLLVLLIGPLIRLLTNLPNFALILIPIYAVGYGWNYVAATVLQVTGHPLAFAIMRGGEGLVRLVVGAVLIVAFRWGAEGSIIAVTAASLVMGCMSYVMMRRQTGYRLPLNWDHARRYLIVGGASIPMTVAAALMQGSDKLLMTAHFGLQEAGAYAFASTIASGLWIVANAFQQVWMPFVFRALSEQDGSLRRQVNIAVLLFMIFMIALTATLIIATHLFVIYASRPEYRQVDRYFVILAVANCCAGMRLLFDNIFYFYEKTMQLSLTVCVGAMISVGLSLYWIPIAGSVGAASATAIAMSVTFAMTVAGAIRLVWRADVAKGCSAG